MRLKGISDECELVIVGWTNNIHTVIARLDRAIH
jgi:hypothetical protein